MLTLNKEPRLPMTAQNSTAKQRLTVQPIGSGDWARRRANTGQKARIRRVVHAVAIAPAGTERRRDAEVRRIWRDAEKSGR